MLLGTVSASQLLPTDTPAPDEPLGCANRRRRPQPTPRPRAWAGTASDKFASRVGLACLVLVGLLMPAVAGADAWTEFERAVGSLAAREFVLQMGETKAPLLMSWLESVGYRITAQSTRHFTYDFTILDTNEDNAFSLPGGHIMVTRGLLNQVTSDEELAGVLAHEVAHSDDRDFGRMLKEQAIFFGLQGLLRHEGRSNLVAPSQVLQVLDTLRQSRRWEGQADRLGVVIAFKAHYDPDGLLAFLRGIKSNGGWLSRLLATHPPGPARVRAAALEAQKVQTSDYSGLMAVADDLARRHHLRRAAVKYRLAAHTWPQRLQPLLDIGKVETERGRDQAAREAYRQALQLQAGETTASQALRALAAPQPPAGTITLSPDQQTKVRAAIADMRQGETKYQQAFARLSAAMSSYSGDARVTGALEDAQVIDPELNSGAYLITVARAYLLLAQAQKTYMLLGEVWSRASANQSLLEQMGLALTSTVKVLPPLAAKQQALAVCAANFDNLALSTTNQATAAMNRAAQACGTLTNGTRLLAGAFLGLVASGRDQPLGRLNYTRFLLWQGDISLAEKNIKEARSVGRALLHEVLQRHLAATALALSLNYTQAAGKEPAIFRALIASRLGISTDDLTARLAHATPGQTARQVLDEKMSVSEPSALQVQDAIMRMCYLDVRAEAGPDH